VTEKKAEVSKDMKCGNSPNKQRTSCRCDRRTLIKGGVNFLYSGPTYLNMHPGGQ
jgi:hypothetical protein